MFDLDKIHCPFNILYTKKILQKYNNAYLVMYKKNPYVRFKYSIAYEEI